MDLEAARLRARLRTESRAPLRKLRMFLYIAFGASGMIGWVVSFFRLLAGRESQTSLVNLAIQTVLIVLVVWLWRLEARQEGKLFERYLAQEGRAQDAG